MNFEDKLITGLFIKRYKRFFVDVNMDKQKVTAHCPNTGSMKGLLEEGNDVYLLIPHYLINQHLIHFHQLGYYR